MDALPQIPKSFERSFYIGNSFAAILYGAQLALCFQSIHYLLRAKDISSRRRASYIAFSLLIALMKATGLMSNTLFGQYTWIEDRDAPGGPGSYFIFNSGWWVNTFGSFSAVFAVALNDGLMLHRTYVILNDSWVSIIVPGLLLVGAFASGLASTGLSALPNGFIFSGESSKLATAWIAMSTAFNLLVTLLIISRLVYVKRQSQLTKEQASSFTSAAAIVIESAVPLAIVGMIAAIFYGQEHPYAFMFTVLWSFFTGVSPQIIILRVAMGKAWSANTKDIVSGTYHNESTKVASSISSDEKTGV